MDCNKLYFSQKPKITKNMSGRFRRKKSYTPIKKSLYAELGAAQLNNGRYSFRLQNITMPGTLVGPKIEMSYYTMANATGNTPTAVVVALNQGVSTVNLQGGTLNQFVNPIAYEYSVILTPQATQFATNNTLSAIPRSPIGAETNILMFGSGIQVSQNGPNQMSQGNNSKRKVYPGDTLDVHLKISNNAVHIIHYITVSFVAFIAS